MKDHFCSIEKEWIGYEGQCNWCGEKELLPKRTWVGLTIEERENIQQECFGKVPHHVAFAHAIEAKLREKNSL